MNKFGGGGGPGEKRNSTTIKPFKIDNDPHSKDLKNTLMAAVDDDSGLGEILYYSLIIGILPS